MALSVSLPPRWATITTNDEGMQRRALAWRVSGVRWLCLLGGFALCRSPLSLALYTAVALYNIAPTCLTPRFTVEQLRLLGRLILILDGVALMLVSLPMLRDRNCPVLLFLFLIEASVRMGYEPPRISCVGMTLTTLATVDYECFALLFGENPWNVATWMLLCAFLGVRGGMLARARWQWHQEQWKKGNTASLASDTIVIRQIISNDADVPPVERAIHTVAASDRLSAREREVLALVARGLSNKEIAKELCAAESTVEKHMEHIARKLKVHNRAYAVSLALKYRWIDYPSEPSDNIDENRPR